MWSIAPPVTCSEAVPVLPASVPVTVWPPTTDAVQVAPVQEPFGTMVNVVAPVTSPTELPYESRPSAVKDPFPPAAIVADGGETTRWSSAAGATVSVAVPLVAPAVAVTVSVPAVVVEQLFAVHDPPGAIVKCVFPVMSPSELPEASKASAAYACVSPAAIVAVAGVTAIRSIRPLRTRRDAVPVALPSEAVTVWSPALPDVQTAPVHEPSGLIAKVAWPVTSPSELSYASRASAV